MNVESNIEYRPVSSFAVVGAAWAAISLLAFITAPLLVLPAIGMIINLLALRSVLKLQGQAAGEWLARIGFATCLLILLAAGGIFSVRYASYRADARAAANGYLDGILANNLAGAFIYRLSPHDIEGQTARELVVAHGRDFANDFMSEQLTVDLKGRGAEAAVAYQGIDGFQSVPRGVQTTVRYRVQLPEGTYDVSVTVMGEYDMYHEKPGLAFRVDSGSIIPVD